MPTIVNHYDKKTGKTRVYESTPHYDPVTKQSRPKRKYLGTLDPETGKLIPSAGRGGRAMSAGKTAAMEGDTASAMIADLQKSISAKEAEIASLRSENEALRAAVRSYEEACGSIYAALGKVPHNP